MQQKKRKMRTPKEEIGVNKLVFESPQGTTFFLRGRLLFTARLGHQLGITGDKSHENF